MMDPDHHHHQHQQNQYQHHFQDLQRALQPPPKQHQQQQPTNGLTRYRSAPSSYFASYLDTIDTSNIVISNTSKSDYNQQQQQQQPRPLSPETESIIEKFMSTVDGSSTDTLTGSKLCDIPENSPVQAAEFMVTVKREEAPQQQLGNNFSSSAQVIYSPNKPPLAKQNLNCSPVSSNSSVENSPFGGASSMFMDNININKINGSISPASNHVSPFRAHMDSNISQQLKIGVGGTGMTSPGTTGGNVIPSPSPFRVPTGGSVSSPFRAPGPVAMDSINQPMKTSGNGLVRHSSLPAGFLANINLDDGFAAMRNLGTNSTNKNSNRNNDSFPSSGRLNRQISFSSGLSSPSSGLDERSFNHGQSINNSTINNSNNNNNNIQENGGGYLTGFPITSWDDSVMLTDNFAGLDDDDDHKAFSDLKSPENQNGEIGNRTPLLAHHLSLPKDAMEKLLHFQDSVPCKIRAKRGMATHPRSIAERVRRTKISERMRKLQDLVPYMDKQTNTADMLDLAVEYIKDLQKQVKLLVDNRAKCSCSG